MIKRGNKKAAIEMSMGTIITIVLAVVFLILALALLRNIFQVSTSSISTIDTKLKSELNKIFTDENENLVIYLGEDRTARIKAGTSDFGVGVAAQTINNVRITEVSQVQYKIELDETAPKNCIKVLGKTKTIGLFNDKLDTWLDSTDVDGPTSYRIISLNIPADTQVCTQLVRVTALDKTVVPEGEVIAIKSFRIEILKKGLF